MKFREVCPKRSLDVVERTNYRDYRDSLRADFNNRCGYCNDLDEPRKEYFEIDHLVPQKIMVNKKKKMITRILFILAILAIMQKEKSGQVAMKIYQ